VNPPHELSESQAKRASALKSTLGPLATFLDDRRVVEVMLNADGVVWIDRIGEGLLRTSVTMSAADAERMLRLVASEVLVELNPQSPSLSAKLPAPWGARLQAAIPPIVDAPVLALRKPARVVFSLEDYVARGILSAKERDALTGAVHVHDNILIGGGTPSPSACLTSPSGATHRQARRTGTTSFSASSATSSVRFGLGAAPAAAPDASAETGAAAHAGSASHPPFQGFAAVPRLSARPSRSTRFPMITRHDPELEQFKRSIDLVEYAKKAGYEPRAQDGAHGLTVLDHPNRDRIVVARSPSGPWVYASVTDYEPRAPGEPAADAPSRLRHCIDRAKDKGSIVEFVQQRDWTARRGEVPLEHERERLRNFLAAGHPLDFEGALQPPPYASGRERSADPAKGGPRPGPEVVRGEVIAQRRSPKLHQRRYDGSPPVPNAPHETEVDERLRRWREAQAAVDLKLRGPGEGTGPAGSPAAVPPPARDGKGQPLPDKPPTDRSESLGQTKNSELNRRRYEWTPAPADVDPLLRATRSRSPDRGR
jgi:hypothetical protein